MTVKQDIEYIIKTLSIENVEQVLKSDEVDEATLKEIRPEVDLLRFVYNTMGVVPTADLPNYIKSEFEGHAQNLARVLNSLVSIPAPFNANSSRQRKQFGNDVRNYGKTAGVSFLPFALTCVANKDWLNHIIITTTRADENVKKSEELRKSAEASAQIRAAASHAKDYEDQASKHSDLAGKWLAATTVAIGITAIVAIVLISCYSGAETVNPAQLTAEILFFASLLYVVSNCTKMYKMNINQQLVNATRAHALRTFQVFVSNAEEDATKAAVLLQTTSTIFGPANTGLMGNDGNEPQFTLPLDTIVRAVCSK